MQDIVCTWMTKNIGGAVIEKILKLGAYFMEKKAT